jgi:chromosome segregation ATPase
MRAVTSVVELETMESSGVAWIVAAVLGLGLVFAWVRLRGETARVNALALDVDRLEGELGASRAQLERRSAEHRRVVEQESELRRKLEKAKKRASQARGEQRTDVDHVRTLEGQLRLREADLKALREELGRAGSSPDDAAARSRETVDQLRKLKQDFASMKTRADNAEARTTKSEEVAAKASKDVARQRVRINNQETLYRSIQLELAAKKDRIRGQTEELERLRAYKVAVVDPLPSVDGPETPTQGGEVGEAGEVDVAEQLEAEIAAAEAETQLEADEPPAPGSQP